MRSRRGRDGGYELARPAADISIADVLRSIDGPLASVHDTGLGDLPYSGATAALTDVWRALRASMRSVLEQTSLADVAAGRLPEHVGTLAGDYFEQEQKRGHRAAPVEVAPKHEPRRPPPACRRRELCVAEGLADLRDGHAAAQVGGDQAGGRVLPVVQ